MRYQAALLPGRAPPAAGPGGLSTSRAYNTPSVDRLPDRTGRALRFHRPDSSPQSSPQSSHPIVVPGASPETARQESALFTPFPPGSRARVVRAYCRPYEDPFRATAGAAVQPDERPTTDIEGWVWAEDPEGRGGWVPLAWLERGGTPWRLTRDFDALELTVAEGEVVALHYAESGFVLVTKAAGEGQGETGGETGWLPDGVLERLD